MIWVCGQLLQPSRISQSWGAFKLPVYVPGPYCSPGCWPKRFCLWEREQVRIITTWNKLSSCSLRTLETQNGTKKVEKCIRIWEPVRRWRAPAHFSYLGRDLQAVGQLVCRSRWTWMQENKRLPARSACISRSEAIAHQQIFILTMEWWIPVASPQLWLCSSSFMVTSDHMASGAAA